VRGSALWGAVSVAQLTHHRPHTTLFALHRADNHTKVTRKKVGAACRDRNKKRKEKTMLLYAGMDLHGDNVFCSVMDEKFSIVFEQRFPNVLKTILGGLYAHSSSTCRGTGDLLVSHGRDVSQDACRFWDENQMGD
jgi:hypothetical protein